MKETPLNFRDGLNAYIRGEFARAAEIFARGHKQGEPECTAQLAICYSEGAGVPRDLNVYYQLAQVLLRLVRMSFLSSAMTANQLSPSSSELTL